MIADKLLSRLNVKKEKGDSWLACCPAHNDNDPSLVITEKDDRVLIKCWAGCSSQEIVNAVGLELTDLFPERPTHRGKPLPPKQRFNHALVIEALMPEMILCELALQATLDDKPLSPALRTLVKNSIDRIHAASMTV